MSSLLPIPLVLSLVALSFVASSSAWGKEAVPPDQQALVEKCTKADTPLACRPALPACEAAFANLAQAPAGAQLDTIRDQLLDQWAWCEDQIGQYAQAEAHRRSQHALRIRIHGREHPEVAATLNSHAVVLDHQGKVAEAESLYRQALAMRQKLLGAEHLDVAISLNNLAGMLYGQGKYAEAESLHRQALAMKQKLLGAEHPDVATSLNNLAVVLYGQGKYTEAERLYRDALLMRQKLLGAEHPQVATSLSNVASVLHEQGKYAEAEPLFRRALAMRQKLLGAEHPQVAQSLSNLASMLNSQGQYAEAESLFRQALTMRQKVLGAEHPAVAESLNNLASMLDLSEKSAEAESLHRQALAMMQKLLGAEHPAVGISLNNLAGVFEKTGKYVEAERLHRQALAMRQKLLGAEHPDIAASLNNLAFVLHKQGKSTEAEPLFRQALAMRQKLLGAEHPEVATSLNRLAALSLSLAAPGEATSLLGQAAVIREIQLRATVSETRMKALIDQLRHEEDLIYGLLFGARSPEADTLALTVALLRKGRVADAGAAANRVLHRSLKSQALHKQFQDWQDLRAQREKLLYAGLGKLRPADYQTRLRELKQQAESLEYLLAAELPELRNVQPPAFDDIVPAVTRRLPQDGVLIEIVWVQPYQSNAPDGSRWGAARYIALLLFPDGHIVTQDLGGAAKIDTQARELRAALESSSSDPQPAAQALFDRILRPVTAHLAGRSRLYLSLDGTLSQVPFDALHDGRDYLLGRYRFHYLTSGRDLLREVTQEAVRPALLMANPVFGRAEQLAAHPGPKTLYQRLGALARLPGTEREAQVLKPLLGVSPLVGEQATEAAVRAARAPRILHIATHGLFLDDTELPVPVEDRGLRSVFAQRSKPAPLDPSLLPVTAEPLRLPGGAGPLSRSALVLAGAARGEQAKSPAEDGLLTAEEARSLDLVGTQLVVLSACETGIGALSAGQGVYGLRRAFLVAGAETLVTSLWRVHDEATGELMALYYGKLFDKQKPRERLSGMIEAMQELRKRPGRSHPYYWAPFLVIGQDGPLRP